MPIYIYGCDKDKEHPQKEVEHKINEEPKITCDECGEKMHRVPQPFRFGFNPFEIWRDWSDDNYRRKRSGRKVVNKYRVMRPSPIGQKDFETRRYKNASK